MYYNYIYNIMLIDNYIYNIMLNYIYNIMITCKLTIFINKF